MIAKVLVDLRTKEVDMLFDYIIPKHLEIEKGMRVYVPFGHLMRLGFVIDIVTDSSYLNLKEISEVLDITPSITEESFLYLDYINKTNNSLLIDNIRTIVPNELFIDYKQILTVKDKSLLEESIALLFGNSNELIYTKNLRDNNSLIKKLIKENIIEVKREYSKRAKDKIISAIYYNKDANYPKAINYKDLTDYVKENEGLIKSDIVKAGFSISAINTLIKHEVLYIKEINEVRNASYKNKNLVDSHKLNKEQQLIYDEVTNNLDKNNIYLLSGITGSGKTEVYINILKEVIRRNKTVLYLVPEISLVAPTANYLKSRDICNVTYYHSNITRGERFDAWNQVLDGKASLIVGTRSSVFLPIDNIGLIIVDEEHDSSYLQKSDVYYDAIDILKIKAKYHSIPILLASATPRVSSMYYAKNNEYKLLELKNRATSQSLPKISFVDMKQELREGNVSIFSKELNEKIKNRLNKNEQTILLYNRKGYANFVLCRNCGYTPKCPSCDVALTYYKDENLLKCSYCDHKQEFKKVCDTCKSTKIDQIGMGIDQVYDRVKKTYPEARVLKMDQNSTKYKGSHEQIWSDFLEHKYDILVGTKMISKGLDFPKVTLVGILMADLELKSPTYLANEETYNLLTQMVGRSGRHMSGEAVIQGYNLDHYAISMVNKSYDEFYERAIKDRLALKYEPFYKVVQIIIANESYLNSYKDAISIKKELSDSFEVILGPSEPYIKYVRGNYRFVLTIKAKKIDYELIQETIKKYNESKITFLNVVDAI
ncbi:replication restart helicase PriA [Haploplasma modicum]|uniref:replication restart helicase PriA n=1 Tax=Haploplasma modicum TaxID=2150 RepID=UPI0005501A8E|nr:primosomal protein N' [Haploplasma modicum]